MPGAYRGLGSGPGDVNSTAGELFVVPAVCVSSTFSTTTTKKTQRQKILFFFFCRSIGKGISWMMLNDLVDPPQTETFLSEKGARPEEEEEAAACDKSCQADGGGDLALSWRDDLVVVVGEEKKERKKKPWNVPRIEYRRLKVIRAPPFTLIQRRAMMAPAWTPGSSDGTRLIPYHTSSHQRTNPSLLVSSLCFYFDVV